MKTLVSIINKIIIIFLVIIIFFCLGNVILSQVFGYQIYAITSGSMKPQYDVGSIVLCHEVPKEEIEVGDNITFRYTNNMIVTHQVKEITEDEKYITQGIANNTTEGPFSYDKIIGKDLKFSIPILGYIYNKIYSVDCIFFTILCVVVLIFTSIVSFKPKE